MKPVILDLFCGAGGAAKGYADAGFDVVGVDINPQPRYPYEFHQGDALDFVGDHVEWFSAIHASPPCQAYSRTRSLHNNEHPEMVAETRAALVASGRPYVIENVVGAPLVSPVVLSGLHFSMTAEDVDGVIVKLLRKRLFETDWGLRPPPKPDPLREFQTASVFGAGGGWGPSHRDNPNRRGGYVPYLDVLSRLMGVDWMKKHELSQSIPPKFAEYVGNQLMEVVSL